MQLERLPDVVGKAYEILGIHIFKTRVRDEAEADAIAKSEIRTPSRSVRGKHSDRTRTGLTEGKQNLIAALGTPPDCWGFGTVLQSVYQRIVGDYTSACLSEIFKRRILVKDTAVAPSL